MNDRMRIDEKHSAGELARLSAIAKVAAEKGWAHYAERLGFHGAGGQEESGAQKSDACCLYEISPGALWVARATSELNSHGAHHHG